jgi:SSS family solute:Na+ symporter
MNFQTIDWIIVVAFFVITLLIGLKYAAKAGENLSEFFLGGRKLTWWVAGTSMVATTFAADTPLLVAGLVATNGISGNWLWWNMLLGGMLTTFFFAKLWRRSGVMTEVELIELRYGGKPAAFLRGFKSVYLGLFMNCIILGWVNVAMMKILKGMFGIEADVAIIYVGLAMLFVAIYSAISGLMGVAITDAIQFIIAMIGCIVLAVIVVNAEQIGGLSGLAAKLPESSLSFFPNIGGDNVGTGQMLAIGVGAFFARIGVQWWSSWYPGGEPGGGGYVAQRMMSCKDEKHAVYATLFFQIAHYCIRPWPWIIVGLCAIILYPQLGADEKELGFVMAMNDYLPTGLKGLLLAAFFAAYMSTISTQLNWGASYLVNDLYNRFINKNSDEKKMVLVSRLVTILLMIISLLVTTQLKTIESAWSFIIECGAGLGLVLILRWYWWRINAWAEIAATVAPFIGYFVATFILKLNFPESFFITVGFTTITWIAVMYLTKPETDAVLENFYSRVKPEGFWNKFDKRENNNTNFAPLICWIASIAMVYSLLFGIGHLLFSNFTMLGIDILVFIISLLLLRTKIKFVLF